MEAVIFCGDERLVHTPETRKDRPKLPGSRQSEAVFPLTLTWASSEGRVCVNGVLKTVRFWQLVRVDS